jgi:hypothetical protein
MDKAVKIRHIRRKRLIAYLFTTLFLTFVIVSLITCWIVASIKMQDWLSKSQQYTFKLGAENSTKFQSSTYKKSKVLIDGVLYINFTDLAEVCGFSVSGDFDQLRYYLRNEFDDYLTVNIGTTSVIVSDQPVSLLRPSFLSDSGDLFLPSDFVNSYFDGIRIYSDESNESILYITYDTTSLYSLTLHQEDVCFPIDPNDVPTENT